jgi:hypothetical protein
LLRPSPAWRSGDGDSAEGREPTTSADARRLLELIFFCETEIFSFLFSYEMRLRNVAGVGLRATSADGVNLIPYTKLLGVEKKYFHP